MANYIYICICIHVHSLTFFFATLEWPWHFSAARVCLQEPLLEGLSQLAMAICKMPCDRAKSGFTPVPSLPSDAVSFFFSEREEDGGCCWVAQQCGSRKLGLGEPDNALKKRQLDFHFRLQRVLRVLRVLLVGGRPSEIS